MVYNHLYEVWVDRAKLRIKSKRVCVDRIVRNFNGNGYFAKAIKKQTVTGKRRKPKKGCETKASLRAKAKLDQLFDIAEADDLQPVESLAFLHEMRGERNASLPIFAAPSERRPEERERQMQIYMELVEEGAAEAQDSFKDGWEEMSDEEREEEEEYQIDAEEEKCPIDSISPKGHLPTAKEGKTENITYLYYNDDS